MADFNKDTSKRIADIKGEEQLQRNLSKILQERVTATGELTKAQKELVDDLIGQKDLEAKLTAIQEKKNEIIEKYKGANADIGEALLKQLEDAEELLKVEEKRKDKSQEIADLGDKLQDGLLGSVGLSKDMLKNGVAFGIGMAVANKAVEFLSNTFNNTVGLAKDLYINMGATADEAGRLGTQTLMASLSIEGLLYGTEGIANAAKEASDYFGTTRGITGDMQKNIAELTALTGDASNSVKLDRIFSDAAGSAADMTDEIRVIAAREGVNANLLFKEMAESADMLVGASKEELANLAKKTAELHKQGLSMKMMEGISDSMLNIESSMQAEMKARALGMGDLASHANDIRAAAYNMQFVDEATGIKMMAEAFDEAGLSSAKLGEMTKAQKKATAAMYGMEVSEMTKMVHQREEFAKLKAANPGVSDEDLLKLQEAKEKNEALYGTIKDKAGQALAAMIPMVAQVAIMNKMQGKGSGFGNLNPFKKAGDQTQQLSKGAKVESKGGGPGGFLKSLGEGLESMGKDAGKKLMGAAVLAATVALVGGGFALAMTILGDVDPMKMIAFSLSMGILGATLALMGSISGNVIMGALALGIVAVALIPAAYAFSLLADVDTQKMMAFSIALPLLALAAAGLGFLSPFIIAGAFAIGVLGAALIPAAVAFGMLGDANMEGIADKLANLGQVSGPLMSVGAGLVSIAAGLGLISAAGLLAMPALGMLIGLAAVAPALTTLANAFGLGGGDSSESSSGGGSSDGSLIEEVKGLRADLQSQPIQIVIDNKVISEITRIQSVKGSRKKY